MEASIKRIILATDFSDISKDAGNQALFLADAYKAELIVLHVLDTNGWEFPSYYFFSTKGFDRLVESQAQVRQQRKDALNKLAGSFDLKVETIFKEGDPGHEIIRVAEEEDADLIVLGTHGYRGWKRFTLGSVAELVGRHTPCTVLTVRPKGK
jgi:nucleotide-binding universal stress UspA family protein